jgi:hypothetical protein
MNRDRIDTERTYRHRALFSQMAAAMRIRRLIVLWSHSQISAASD